MTLAPRALHGVVERVFRRRDGDVGSHPVIYDLRVAADIGDDRHAAGEHRFDQHDRQPLAARGKNQSVLTAPDCGDVVHEASEGHVGEA